MRIGQLVALSRKQLNNRGESVGTNAPGPPDKAAENFVSVVMRSRDVGIVIAQDRYVDVTAGHEYVMDEVLLLCNDRLGWFLADDMRIVRNSVKRSDITG